MTNASVAITVENVSITPNTTTTLTASGTTIQTITLNGFGFSTTAGHNTVTLTGGTVGAVTIVSSTQLKVAVTNLVAGTLTAKVA